jgi:hypothetical protein
MHKTAIIPKVTLVMGIFHTTQKLRSARLMRFMDPAEYRHTLKKEQLTIRQTGIACRETT